MRGFGGAGKAEIMLIRTVLAGNGYIIAGVRYYGLAPRALRDRDRFLVGHLLTTVHH